MFFFSFVHLLESLQSFGSVSGILKPMERYTRTPAIPQEWPESYYALPPKERYFTLQEHLNQFPDSQEDRRRLELFEKRYNKTYDDGFMLAWMMLKVADSQGVTALTRPRYKHEVETELKRLCVLNETRDDILEREWSEFAAFLIETYLNSSPYRSMIFGIGAWSQRTTAQRFAREIITVTKTVPGRIGLAAEIAPLRDIIQKRFTELVEDGDELLKEAERSVH